MTHLNPPFQIPGYRIVRRVGLGGMAAVYLAIQESLKRPVAVKVLASERAPSDELVRRFEHEARTIARLDHPHIVTIFDVGRTSTGQIYYTMPYLSNGDLSTRNLRDQPRRILQIMRALTEALACAHDKGIVHRDVKPENVLFDKLDRPLLADFGIALSNSNQPRFTREGATIGSSGYMSPEQARGLPLDGRSDFYGLGVVCYELLTGEVPFHGPDALAVALAHVEQPVPRLPVTRRVWQPLIDRALAKQPDARFQSAEELLAALSVVERRLTTPRHLRLSGEWLNLLGHLRAFSRRQRAIALGAFVLAVFFGLLALLPRVPQSAAMAESVPIEARATDMPANDPVVTDSSAAAANNAPTTAIATPVPVDAAVPADSPSTEILAAPTTAVARSEHLRMAASLLTNGRMVLPAGNNAADHYLAVLAGEPHQHDAVSGIERILSTLSARAGKAIAADHVNDAIEPVGQVAALAERTKWPANARLAGLVAPLHDAIEARRASARNPFNTAELDKLSALLPILARLDPEQARALEADLARPVTLLRAGGTFRETNGPTVAVITANRAAAAHVDHAFAIQTTDVTRGAYAHFVAASGRAASTCHESQSLLARLPRGLDWRAPGFAQTDDHPVVCISWNDANAYARWLSKRTGATYRLPSRQEWLIAAQQAGTGRGCRMANIAAHVEQGATCDDGFVYTAPVGRFAATPLGLYDMAGNVSAWIDGCASDGSSDTACNERVFRGLSWHDDDDDSNLDRVDTAPGDVGYANVGFRVVRELPRG
ncbi:MAG: bifunctional serine/threonine-protein kinase/formylglycine-generating enzyme family protein [Dokdonella sp.]